MLQHCRAHRRLGTWAPATTGAPYYRTPSTLEAPRWPLLWEAGTTWRDHPPLWLPTLAKLSPGYEKATFLLHCWDLTQKVSYLFISWSMSPKEKAMGSIFLEMLKVTSFAIKFIHNWFVFTRSESSFIHISFSVAPCGTGHIAGWKTQALSNSNEAGFPITWANFIILLCWMFLGPAIWINGFSNFQYISVSTFDHLGPGQHW